MLSTVENNYVSKLKFVEITPSVVKLTALVDNEQAIKPVMWMIEANMYTRKELRAMSTECKGDVVNIQSLDNTAYSIKVKVK